MNKALKHNGYPEWTLNKKKNEKQEKREWRGKVVAPYVKTVSEKLSKIMKKYNVQVIHKPIMKLKGQLCKVKDEVHELDKVGAIYEVECKKHQTEYIGETERALRERAYEHRIISHKDSKRSHSITLNENYEEIDNNETIDMNIRRSSRNKNKKIDYKKMNKGENIITEGTTIVSKHVAEENHETGDLTIKAVSFEKNWRARGIKEAIEIRKKKPSMNQDEGRYYLSAIYNRLVKEDKTMQVMETESSVNPQQNLENGVLIRR